MNKKLGIILTIISAIIFGIMPILASYTYRGNCNAVTLTFLRSFFAIFLLYAYCIYKKIDLKVAQNEIIPLILGGLFVNVITTTTLFMSYSYISVGMATTLHFVYPIIVTFACFILYKDEINIKKIVALVLSFVAIILFFKGDANISFLGIFLALLSGCSYSFFLIYISKSILKDMNLFKINYYFSVIGAIILYIGGSFMGKIFFGLTPIAWGFSILISFLTAVVATICIQNGVLIIGPSAASILSTFEPITGIVLGVMFLGETLTIRIVIGCILIIMSVILITLSENNCENMNKS